jgi:subtilisin-like proprotein convertase family protein
VPRPAAAARLFFAVVGSVLALALPSTAVATAPPPPPGCTQSSASASSGAAVAIPAGPAVVTSTVNVSGAGAYLAALDVETNITHTFPADLDMTLASPAGTIVTLSTDNGDGNDNVFAGTVWDDDADPGSQVPYEENDGLVTDRTFVDGVTATPLVPEEALGAFIGENPNGTWTLTVSDDNGVDAGSIEGWSLAATTAACVLPLGAPPTAVTLRHSPIRPCAKLRRTVRRYKRQLARARGRLHRARKAARKSGGRKARRAVKRDRAKVGKAKRKLKRARRAAKRC